MLVKRGCITVQESDPARLSMMHFSRDLPTAGIAVVGSGNHSTVWGKRPAKQFYVEQWRGEGNFTPDKISWCSVAQTRGKLFTVSKYAEAHEALQAIYDMEQAGKNAINTEDVAAAIGESTSVADDRIKWLHTRDYIKGIGVWGGGLLRMSTTTKGQNVIESGARIEDLEDPRKLNQPSVSTTNIHNNTSGGTLNQQVGDNNQQHVTIEVSSNDVASLVAALRDAGADKLADDVIEATANGKEPGKIGRALKNIIPALTATKELGAVAAVIAGFIA